MINSSQGIKKGGVNSMETRRNFLRRFNTVLGLLLFFQSLQYGSSLDDWYPGDGHIHSSRGEGSRTISKLAKTAKDKGLSWIIITDHDSDFLNREKHRKGPFQGWKESEALCQKAQAEVGILVMCGEEVGGDVTKKESFGHYLAYNIGGHIEIDYRVEGAQDIIDKVNQANNGRGFGFIAHPYWTRPWWAVLYWPWDYGYWKDWDVTGYTGIEMLSHAYTDWDATYSKWIELLKRGKGGGNVGIAGSDFHRLGEILGEVGDFPTYCLVKGKLTHEAIYDALREERVVFG
jgi:hypothetical protein